eukprot:403332311
MDPTPNRNMNIILTQNGSQFYYGQSRHTQETAYAQQFQPFPITQSHSNFSQCGFQYNAQQFIQESSNNNNIQLPSQVNSRTHQAMRDVVVNQSEQRVEGNLGNMGLSHFSDDFLPFQFDYCNSNQDNQFIQSIPPISASQFNQDIQYGQQNNKFGFAQQMDANINTNFQSQQQVLQSQLRQESTAVCAKSDQSVYSQDSNPIHRSSSISSAAHGEAGYLGFETFGCDDEFSFGGLCNRDSESILTTAGLASDKCSSTNVNFDICDMFLASQQQNKISEKPLLKITQTAHIKDGLSRQQSQIHPINSIRNETNPNECIKHCQEQQNMNQMYSSSINSISLGQALLDHEEIQDLVNDHSNSKDSSKIYVSGNLHTQDTSANPNEKSSLINGGSSAWRKDVVYKTILRRLRKDFLNEFNEKTKYILTKRSRKPDYLTEKLGEYADYLISETQNGSQDKGIINPQELRNELVFFMGSIFYSKHMKNLYDSKLKKNEIEVIHSSLYQFTKKKLSHLESYGAYHFLINNFHEKNKDGLLNINFNSPQLSTLSDNTGALPDSYISQSSSQVQTKNCEDMNNEEVSELQEADDEDMNTNGVDGSRSDFIQGFKQLQQRLENGKQHLSSFNSSNRAYQAYNINKKKPNNVQPADGSHLTNKDTAEHAVVFNTECQRERRPNLNKN